MLYFLLSVDVVVGIFVVIMFAIGIYKSRKSALGMAGTVAAQAQDLTNRSSMIGLLTTIFIVLSGTIIGYANIGSDEAFDYISFAMPAIAGVVAGGGILASHNKIIQPLKLPEFFWYMLSVFFIVIGYAGYILRHPAKPVTISLILSAAIALLLWLVNILIVNGVKASAKERVIKGIAYLFFIAIFCVVAHDGYVRYFKSS